LAGDGYCATGVLGQSGGAGEDGADGAVLHVEGTGAVHDHIASGTSEGAIDQSDVGEDGVERIDVESAAVHGEVAGGRQRATHAQSQSAASDGGVARESILCGQGHRAGGVFGQTGSAGENRADGAILDIKGATAVDRHVAGGAGNRTVDQRNIAETIVI